MVKKLVIFAIALAAIGRAQIQPPVTPDFSSNAAAVAPDYTNYVPQFQNDIVIFNPWADPNRHIQDKTPVNPEYALSETSALQLATVLKDYNVTIFHSGPFGWVQSWGYEPNRLVPWFRFPDGTLVNAGLIGWYWSHGYPPSLVWLWVKGDLSALFEWGTVHTGAYDWVTQK